MWKYRKYPQIFRSNSRKQNLVNWEDNSSFPVNLNEIWKELQDQNKCCLCAGSMADKKSAALHELNLLNLSNDTRKANDMSAGGVIYNDKITCPA